MKLHKGGEVKTICDICFKEGPLYKREGKMIHKKIHKGIGKPNRFKVEACCECFSSMIDNLQYDPVKRLKWYILLYKYQKEGYRIVELTER